MKNTHASRPDFAAAAAAAAIRAGAAGADIARRVKDIDAGIADVITFGRPVLANPDFVE